VILLLVVIPVAVGLLANQVDALGAWIAVPIARWAARVRYADDPDRAAERAQDWAAQIEQSIPGSLFKLGFAIGLAGRGLAAATARTSRQAASLGPVLPAKGRQSVRFCTWCGQPEFEKEDLFCEGCGSSYESAGGPFRAPTGGAGVSYRAPTGGAGVSFPAPTGGSDT
jgi:hypothetical protein